MKITKHLSIIAGLFLAAPIHSPAIVGLSIERDCTSVIISWPSTGNEYYLIQHRPTLDPSTPWTNLTNNYPANSTNRTTYTVYGVAAPCSGGGSSMMMAANSAGAGSGGWSGPQVMPKDGSRRAVPLNLYPRGINLTGHVVVWPDGSTEDWTPKLAEDYEASKKLTMLSESFDGPEPQNASGGGDEVDSGFFRVFHIPDWAFNVTNYIYGGPTFFPVDFKDYLERVKKIEVLLNGVITPHAEFTSIESGGQTNWGVGIYFDRITNGVYQIQLQATLALNEITGDRSVYLGLSNLPVSIDVENEITFPDWDDFIQGDTYTFKAQSTDPNVDWWIDIYDVWGNYVNTGSGATASGMISWTWDLNDWQGNNRDDFESDPFFYGEITIDTPATGEPSQNRSGPTTKPTPIPVKGFPDRGEWLVAYQDRWFIDSWGMSPSLQETYTNTMNSIAGGPILKGDAAYTLPLKFGTNVYTQSQREQSWGTFLNALGDLRIRNLYYRGHGGATSLGADYHFLSTNGYGEGGMLSYPGSKSILESWQIAGKTKNNRFRFVFLDGCSTAGGNLPNAFNISKQTNTISFYENHPKHPRPSVFVGWNEDVGGDPSWGFEEDYLQFQASWMGRWANTLPLPSIVNAIDFANNTSGWISSGKLWGALKVYGYQEMTIRDYNRKGDWRWP